MVNLRVEEFESFLPSSMSSINLGVFISLSYIRVIVVLTLISAPVTKLLASDKRNITGPRYSSAYERRLSILSSSQSFSIPGSASVSAVIRVRIYPGEIELTRIRGLEGRLPLKFTVLVNLILCFQHLWCDLTTHKWSCPVFEIKTVEYSPFSRKRSRELQNSRLGSIVNRSVNTLVADMTRYTRDKHHTT